MSFVYFFRRLLGFGLLALTILIGWSCQRRVPSQPLFELMGETGVDFDNKVTDSKAENSFQFRNYYNGGGVALGDINNDGLADIILTSNLGDNKLYLNHGKFKFEDITATSGLHQNGQWSTGVTMVDINHDGWLDIYVCNSGHLGSTNRLNQLYINNHNNTFTEAAADYGLDHSGFSTQAVFFDYDLDGDLDCLLIDNSPIPFGSLNYAGMRDSAQKAWNVSTNLMGGGNHLFRNDHGHFHEVTREAGLHTSLISFGLGVSVADINGDGYPDIYVGNDFIERDYLYINQRNGTFRDSLPYALQHTSMSSMGTDIADINNDGYPDIYTTDMFPGTEYRLKTTGTFDNIDLFRSKIKSGFYHQYVRNCLQLNNTQGHFKDIANYGGVAATDWSWGLVLFDADNDGYNDIYVCNGINRDLSNLDFLDFFSNGMYQRLLKTNSREDIAAELIRKIPQTPLINKAYKNLGNLTFQDAGSAWGFTQPSFSNSVAYADLDNDGDLDLVINNENQPTFIYKNNAREHGSNHSISVSLKANGENNFAIGAKIKCFAGAQVFSREIEPVRGFQSSVDYKQVIGLGRIKQLDSMLIIWPDQSETHIIKPLGDRLYRIDESLSAHPLPKKAAKRAEPALLLKSPSTFDKHQENDYVDFYRESNIPEMLSRQGPHAAVGDVDGDGRDDIYVAGALNQPGQLYIQQVDGAFKKQKEVAFTQFTGFEEIIPILFDADGDGDLDLFVGSGGNTVPQGSRELQHRLYLNDGKGHFKLAPTAFPLSSDNSSVAIPFDFDGDGDLDLFVGARNVPQQYGLNPTSVIYINNGKGHFTAMSPEKTGGISSVGMVTAAAWSDVLGGGRKQLIIVGEWMNPRVFRFDHTHFVEEPTNLTGLYGLWRSVTVADINGDGLNDLILGNIGENFYLQPQASTPVKLWVNDFDHNGTLDKIMTYTVGGKDLPIVLKNDLEAQLPFLKKQNLLHEQYAGKSIQELISEPMARSSLVKIFNYCPSIVAINKGHGQFILHKLPPIAQLSSIYTILPTDVKGDGYPDLIMGGNDFDFLPQLGRLDANFGTILLNDKKGDFYPISDQHTGIFEPGETRDIQAIRLKGKPCFVWLTNDGSPSVYCLNTPPAPLSPLIHKK